MPKPIFKRSIFSILAAVFGLAFIYCLIDRYGFSKIETHPLNVSVAEIGTQMLSTTEHGYILPFEVVSMLLLAAMIGCIVIAMKEKNPIIEPPKPKEAKLMIHSDFQTTENQNNE
jgi:NADH-quinone oxidoreductase subunit J